MAGMRLAWVAVTSSSAIVAQGTRTAVYGARLRGSGASVATASLLTGGAGGSSLIGLSCIAATTDRDALNGNGGYIEFPDGVYATLTGAPTDCAILVQKGED